MIKQSRASAKKKRWAQTCFDHNERFTFWWYPLILPTPGSFQVWINVKLWIIYNTIGRRIQFLMLIIGSKMSIFCNIFIHEHSILYISSYIKLSLSLTHTHSCSIYINRCEKRISMVLAEFQNDNFQDYTISWWSFPWLFLTDGLIFVHTHTHIFLKLSVL